MVTMAEATFSDALKLDESAICAESAEPWPRSERTLTVPPFFWSPAICDCL